jgi:D-psicose/D-tagatose/L-ribulose 3-epimerase
MRFGASAFIWASPFSNRTLELMDRAKAIGFDLVEICIEEPDTIDVLAIRAKAAQTDIGVTICASRNLSAEEDAVRGAGLEYLKRCIEVADGLGSPFVSGPMYCAVGATQLLDKPARQAQWDRAVGSLRVAAAYAKDRGIKLAVEP